MILISVSQVARIIGMSHWHPARSQFFRIKTTSPTWWGRTIILAFGRLRQKYHKFEFSLCYTVRPS
jgi:hypothetical protein